MAEHCRGEIIKLLCAAVTLAGETATASADIAYSPYWQQALFYLSMKLKLFSCIREALWCLNGFLDKK